MIFTHGSAYAQMWYMVSNTRLEVPTPGTMGEQYGIYSTGFFVDLKSIVKRGSLVYWSENWKQLDRNLWPIKGLDSKDGVIRAGDCSKGLVKASPSQPWEKETSPELRKVLDFVCKH